MSRRISICIINPRFEPSFWGHDFALPLFPADKRCWMATGALPLLAALVPPEHHVEILDENVEAIDFERLRRYDVIGITGMIVQQRRMLEILEALEGFPAVVAVGGPFVTVCPEVFTGRAGVIFLGEAEETWPEFLITVAAGSAYKPVYQQAGRTDMSRVPAPRYDLLKTKHYVCASVQFSRGCPFTCEFCDIITIFGRRPRLKTPAQLLNELEQLHKAGFYYAFLVDDNFIGNRIAAKQLLRELIAWQRRHGYPLHFSTEASIDLADEPELIELMVEANILHVFIGIESPRRDSLKETRKHQNIRGDSLLAKVSRIRDGGLVISAGFIVGFDSDDSSIFDEQFAFIQEAGLAQVIPAILFPIPTTPLHARLAAENRLDTSDPDVCFHPRQMSRQELREGHRQLLLRLYEPEAYFGRLFAGYRGSAKFRSRRSALSRSIGRKNSAKAQLYRLMQSARMAVRLLAATAGKGYIRRLWPAYFHAFWRENRSMGRDAIPFGSFVQQCAQHWHYYRIARERRHTAFAEPSSTPAAPLIQIRGNLLPPVSQ